MLTKQTNTDLPLKPLLLIAPFFLWGTAMVAMKGVIPHTTPLFMAGMRLVPAGVLVLLFCLIQGRPQPKTWKAWLWIGLFALVDGALFQGFLAEGLVRTNAGLGSVMIDTQPLAVAILCLWLFNESIRFWGWLGLVIGVIGISAIGLPDQLILGWFNLLPAEEMVASSPILESGEWLMLLAALSMAVGTVLVRGVCRHCDPVVGTGWHMIIGGLPLFMLSGGWEADQWVNIDGGGWMAIAYSTIFGSAIAYGLFFYFASSGSLTSLSSLTFLTPIFALLFGNLFLGEVLTPLQSMGVGLTLVSIYLVNQRDILADKFKFGHSAAESIPSETTQPMEVSLPVKIPESEPKL
ncbi:MULTISPECIES: DMT family transporter [Limnospira]|uniref:Permease (Membrane component) n=1 Tax=Limnospira indica PCC 8005 TaxID=376219 RepID=A0A9P1KL94_9CYAN|nr:DMT family transporter [Limnospira indica]CDM98553.1 putative permease (membrane component) [Limnospira indica PCC 8005]